MLRPNGCMDQDVTWYGARPRPRQLCVRWGPISPPQKGSRAPKFSAHVYCVRYSNSLYLRLGGYVFVVVCLSVCLSVSNFAQKTFERICMKFSEKVLNGPMNKIAALARRTLAEVCTVPVLLVITVHIISSLLSLINQSINQSMLY